MPPRPRPKVYYLGRTRTECGQHTVTLSVDSQRWEYTLQPHQCDTVEYLCKRISALKALAYAKSRSTRQVKI